MVKVAIFGASGDLGSALLREGRSRSLEIKGFSRNPKQVEVSNIQDFYDGEKFDKYIITFGSFEVTPFVESNDVKLEIALEDNFLSVARMIRRILTTRKDEITEGAKIDFFVVGSTSSYKGFANTAHYCAAKFALRGLLESLNEEYASKNVRFCLFSMGTMKSKMAEKILNQDESTFLSAGGVARRLFDLIDSEDEGFQYEVILKRRVVR
jgi:short-subunit dehydrogenase